jgi:LysR family nitrogen assimilation transcriptional regulator
VGRCIINFRQLQYFHQIVQSGSFSAAAKELHVAQTALGVQVKNLEERLGTQLLERHSKGVRPTAAGRLLNQYAVEIIAHIEEAKKAVRALGDDAKPVIRIGITPSLMRVVGDDILMELQNTVQGVSLELIEQLTVVQMQLLERGELDCALCYALNPDPALKQWHLLEEQLYFLQAPEDVQQDGPIEFADAISHDLATVGQGDSVCQTLRMIAARMGKQINVTYEVQSIRAVKNIVQKRAAATVMPYGAAAGEIEKGRIVARPIVSPPVVRTLMLLYPREEEYRLRSAPFEELIKAIAWRVERAEGPMTRLLI